MSANLNSRLFLEGVESRAQPHQGGFLPSPRGHHTAGIKVRLEHGEGEDRLWPQLWKGPLS